jgi:hypothetical protein
MAEVERLIDKDELVKFPFGSKSEAAAERSSEVVERDERRVGFAALEGVFAGFDQRQPLVDMHGPVLGCFVV